MAIVRLTLVLVPVRLLTRSLERVARPGASRLDPTPGEADRVGWAVASAARFVPGANCLAQALVAEAMLRRRGHPVELRLGVARDELGRIQAHAWVESYGHIVIGDHDRDRFTELRPVAGAGAVPYRQSSSGVALRSERAPLPKGTAFPSGDA